MTRILAALLALLLLAAPALAGTEEEPEVEDAEGDSSGGATWGDVTLGWFTDTATDITFTMRVAILQAPPPNAVWYAQAGLNGEGFLWGAGSFSGAVSYFYARIGDDGNPTDFQTGTGTMEQGQPGTFTFNIPKDYIGNLTIGSALTTEDVGTGLVIGAPVPVPVPIGLPGQFQNVDQAQGAGYVLQQGTPPPDGPSIQEPGTPGNDTTPPPTNNNGTGDPQPPPAGTPGLEASLLVAALGAVAVAARRRR